MTVSLINIETLKELQNLDVGNPNFLFEVMGLFMRDVPPGLEKLRQSFKEGNAAEVSDAAHGLKSMAQNLGAESMGQLCARLDALGRGGSLEGAGVMIDELLRVFGEIEIRFKKILDNKSLD